MKKYIAFLILTITINLVFSQVSKTSGKVSVDNKVNLTDSFTHENSGLVSNNVHKIFIDSFDVKWFGTDKGISRWDGDNWTIIDKSNYLRNNTVNDILYEKTKYGDELWVATNGGLSVMSYNVDGVTSATTYYVGGPESGIISDTVTALGLDKNHVRWISTPRGINTFGNDG
jgi:ligand-binding sensor domain-containing protein